MDGASQRILLPIEIKRRELAGKLLLAVVLAGRNHAVFMGSRDIINHIDTIRPNIYFELSAVNRNGKRSRLRRLKKCDTTTLVLDTEGSAFGGKKEYQQRTSAEMLAHTDCFCAWGSKAADVASTSDRNDNTKIEITGNPRFDVLQKPYYNVYSPKSEELRGEYSPYILINTNFSINHVDITHIREYSLINDDNNFKNQTRILASLLSAISELANHFSNRKIIVRPHPSEDPSLYRRIFTPYENVIIKKEGEVRPWILASDAVIHNSCTTGVTSALFGTPVIAYMPHGLQISSTPNDVSTKCRSISELIHELERYIDSSKKYTMSESQISSVKPHIDNIDYLSSVKIAEIIDSMEHKKPHSFSQHFSPSIKQRGKRGLVRAVGPGTFEEIYYQRLKGGRSIGYKFSETPVDEIASLIDSFPSQIVPESLTIKRMPGVMYGFQITKEDNEVF